MTLSYRKINLVISNQIKFEQIIGYTFENKKILEIALTHKSSEKNNNDHISNQRYECLGDAVLELIITRYLFDNYTKMDEGDLTKIRSSAVNQNTLVEVAIELSIGEFLLMSRSEEASGGRSKKSILEDSIEALIAAIYLDGGISKIQVFIERYFFPKIANLSILPGHMDYKTRLQEIYAKNGKRLIYRDTSKGPDHKRLFFSNVEVDKKIIGKGEGHSKKSAQQSAAEKALQQLED